jgi:hypothetical protein
MRERAEEFTNARAWPKLKRPQLLPLIADGTRPPVFAFKGWHPHFEREVSYDHSEQPAL